jgi:hypothetical protein
MYISIKEDSTGCPTTYQTRYFFNNSKTNEDIATRFEQVYVRCVRKEEEFVCSVCLFRCNIFIGFRIIKEIPGLVDSGTPYTRTLIRSRLEQNNARCSGQKWKGK